MHITKFSSQNIYVSITVKRQICALIFQRNGVSKCLCVICMYICVYVYTYNVCARFPDIRSHFAVWRERSGRMARMRLTIICQVGPLTTSYVVLSDKGNFVGRAEISRLSFLLVAFQHVVRDSRFHNCASALGERLGPVKLHATWRTSRRIRVKYIEIHISFFKRKTYFANDDDHNLTYKFISRYYRIIIVIIEDYWNNQHVYV